MDQNELFRRSEGNAWFDRNKTHMSEREEIANAPDVSFICSTLAPFSGQVSRVLEIGCSSGLKLETICGRLAAAGEGVEPSRTAVDEGNARSKSVPIRLQTGTGDALPFQAAAFDLVYFAFCLYLFDRTSLLKAFAEADRVLKPGGFLAITDFDPGTRQKRPYSHCEGVFSYKQDYAAPLTATGLYYLVGKVSYSHGKPHFDEAPGERVSTSILYKENDPYPTSS